MQSNQHIRWYDGVITERHGTITVVGGLPIGDSETIRYDARAVNTRDRVVLTNHLPERRYGKNVDVVVAEVNHPCRISLEPQADGSWKDRLFAYTEAIPFEDACQ